MIVMVAVVEEEQPVAVDVIVNTVTCCVLVLLISVPLIGDPVPLAAMPVRFTVLSLVQLNVVVATAFGFEITIDERAIPEHTV